MTERVITADLVLFLDDCGIPLNEVRGNNQLLFDLKDALNQGAVTDLDGLLVAIGTIIQELADDGQERVTTLEWLLRFSEHLDAKPIDLLIKGGWFQNAPRIVLAAKAWSRNVPPAEWKAGPPESAEPAGAVVLEFRRRPPGQRPPRRPYRPYRRTLWPK